MEFTASWGSREPLDITLAAPRLVAEIDADTAMDRGAWRHPVRYLRLRDDIDPSDVPAFGAGTAPASG
ncbi:hypothetical protein [Streptomyces sp. NPDC046978]|uniref:hypothetical protein n=1 Tax=unclassified Streptomyces TaxID=2593676 RepID=UPI0033DE587E